jgi:hypothetical protein
MEVFIIVATFVDAVCCGEQGPIMADITGCTAGFKQGVGCIRILNTSRKADCLSGIVWYTGFKPAF